MITGTDHKKPTTGIAVDGSCMPNPGDGKIRGVDIATGKLLFEHSLGYSTNNITEFVAIVKAMDHIIKTGVDLPIYSDSTTALSWIRDRECRTNTKTGESSESAIKWASTFLDKTEHTFTVLKWFTREWGEIPADFGNKPPYIVKATCSMFQICFVDNFTKRITVIDDNYYYGNTLFGSRQKAEKRIQEIMIEYPDKFKDGLCLIEKYFKK